MTVLSINKSIVYKGLHKDPWGCQYVACVYTENNISARVISIWYPVLYLLWIYIYLNKES